MRLLFSTFFSTGFVQTVRKKIVVYTVGLTLCLVFFTGFLRRSFSDALIYRLLVGFSWRALALYSHINGRRLLLEDIAESLNQGAIAN
jgi:hypothetical protein